MRDTNIPHNISKCVTPFQFHGSSLFYQLRGLQNDWLADQTVHRLRYGSRVRQVFLRQQLFAFSMVGWTRVRLWVMCLRGDWDSALIYDKSNITAKTDISINKSHLLLAWTVLQGCVVVCLFTDYILGPTHWQCFSCTASWQLPTAPAVASRPRQHPTDPRSVGKYLLGKGTAVVRFDDSLRCFVLNLVAIKWAKYSLLKIV